MIKPADIQEKEFSRAVRGYKEDEVNAFLDEITLDLERLLNELRETKEENSRLVEELERHRGSEGTVVETLDAELMKKEARETSEEIARESESIRIRFINFRTKYKQLLESELQRFDSLSMEIFPELAGDDFGLMTPSYTDTTQLSPGYGQAPVDPAPRDTLRSTKV